MADGGGGGGGGGGETSGSRLATSYEAVGGRQRFTVELRPGETTIVSWKKLLKDAITNNNASTSSNSSKPNNGPGPSQTGPSSDKLVPPPPPPPPPPPSHPSLDARLAPGQVLENEVGEGPPTSRLSTVIEKIERLYVGKASSDEEDLDNDVVPDDDEYDTEDSFIDDAELDEYFQVDNSAIKHEGFFVNRGKLERIEPTPLPNQQPKKRRRKELAKDHSGDVRLNPNKHLRVGKKGGKSVPLNGKNSPLAQPDDVKFQNQINAPENSSRKKSADIKTSLEAPPSGVSYGAALLQEKDIDQQKILVLPSKNHGSKLKEGSEFSDTSNERLNDKSSYAQGKLSSGRSLNNVDELDASIQQREKGDFHERPETSVPEGTNSLQIAKVPSIQRKEGSSARPKSTMLEKAIRDLEKLVSESRPPAMEVHDVDNNTSQAVKRRLPPEIKQKLAKVARLAQASHGKITKELLNRLLTIVGHMIQLRSLKRNLEIMVNVGLSAKQEKDNRVQQIKKEVAEMVRTRIPVMKSKALEQLAGTSDDFQQSNAEEKEDFKRKYSMDDALEDIICDLYDLYVEGLEEDAGPQVRKLYAELAALWPSGFMDNHGIKRAICRAKDRRRAVQSQHKDQQKIKKQQVLASKTEETVRVEAYSPSQPLYAHDNLVPDASDHGLTSDNKSISSSAAASAAVQMPVTDRLKQEKLKGSISNSSDTKATKQEKVKGSFSNSSDTKATDVLAKKKVKRKPDVELGEAQFHSEKLASLHGEERHKTHKQVAVPLPRSDLQPAAPSFQPLI